MRYVYPGLLIALSVLSPGGFAATGPSLSIGNYHLLSEVKQTRTTSLFTYSADLTNSGQAQPSVTATVTSSVPSIVVQPGQGNLRFPAVAANSTVTSTNFFTVLVDRTGNTDFSNLTWQFSTPVANAGSNQTVVAGSTVTLDGSGSTNPSGTGTLTYSWAFAAVNGVPAGSAAVIQSPNSVMPTFVADRAGNYIIVLTVSNGAGVDSSSVTITTSNSPPVADAGPDQTLQAGTVVTLDGSKSHDVDGDSLTYSWVFVQVPAGSLAVLSGSTTVSPTFRADRTGTYKVQLIVNDGTFNSAPAQVTISSDDTPPVANAGTGQSVTDGTVVQLDGSKSTDVDGNILTYRWSFNSLPTGSLAVLSDTTIVNPTFTPDLPGNYVVQLIVNDGFIDSNPATVTISTTAILKPTANAGQNQTVAHGATVNLAGSGTDPQSLTLTYLWSMTSKPTGSQAALDNPNIATPRFLADLPGSYVLQLIVNNGTLNSDPSMVTITTTNTAPVANAGQPQTVTTGSVVTLDGSLSHDADNDQITYSWAFQSIPPGSGATLLSAGIVSPTFIADLAGTYVVQLIVSDPFTSSTPATVTITSTQPAAITLTPNPLNVLLNAPGTLTVTLGSAAGPSGQSIHLASFDTTIVTVSNVMVPAGQFSTTATVTPAGNTGSTQILASASGFQPGFATVNVTEAAITLSLSNNAVGVTKTVTGTVTLSAPVPSGGITVNLTADTGGIVSFPASINIASGNTGTFTVTGAAAGTATITAASSNYVSGSATITAATIGAITLPPQVSVVAGQTLPFSVSLVSAAPSGGVTISLLSSDTTKATVSASVFIDSGQTTPTVAAQVTGIAIGSASITASAGGFTGASSDVTVVPGLVVNPASLPVGTVGVVYTTTTITASGGTGPYTITSANLPAGLTFSTGVLSGTPTAAGSGSIIVKDSSPGTPLTQTLTVTVNPGPLVVSPTLLPNGTVGVVYPTTTIIASGGASPYTMTSANLPSGLSFTGGVLSGTPLAPGAGTITVTDSTPGTPQTYTLTVTILGVFVISPASLPNGTAGVMYPTTTISATGGTQPYTMTSANLPAGLTFTGGVLSGIPTAIGTGTITVTDSTPGTPKTAILTVTIVAPPLVLSPTSLPIGTEGVLYPTTTISATGGTAPYTMTSANLPAGLTFTGGVLSGTPTLPGTGTITVTDSTPVTPKSSTLAVTINPSQLVVSPTTLPNGTGGTAYPATTITASGGTPPYTMTAASLPAGLTFTGGVLSGTPTVPGTGTITIKDSATAPQQIVTLPVTIIPGPLVVTPASPLPSGQALVAYSPITVSASGGTPPYTMTAAGLPAGLTFTGGVLSGTPTLPGTGTITVTDSTPVTPKTAMLSVTINPAPLAILPASLAAGVSGTVYPTTVFGATGGTLPYTFSATGLPPGMSLTAGVLTGTPSVAGSATITVTDSSSPVMTSSVSLTINPSILVITTASPLVTGTVNISYSATVAATGGYPPYSFSATGLPAGLTMRTNGQITGTPTAPGTSQVVVTVTDSGSSGSSVRRAGGAGRRDNSTVTMAGSAPSMATATLTLVINPAPLVMVTGALPNGTVGTLYSQALVATGGTQPYTWSIVSGSLPSGLNLSPAGAIVGTPTGTGPLSTTLVLGVKDSGTQQMSATSQPITITIAISGTTPYLTVAPATVGQNLQTTIGITLNNFTSSTNLTITSDNPNVKLSKNPTLAGSTSLTLVGVISNFYLYVQGGASSGSANITAHSPQLGSIDGTAVVTLAPSAFVLSGPNGIGASILSNENVTIPMSVIGAQLDSSGNPAQTQQLAGGLTQVVTLGTSNAAAGTLPASVSFTGGTDTVAFNFVGGSTVTTTVVTANEPAVGFSTPSQNANMVAITIQAANMTATNVTVGQNLETPAVVTLSGKTTSGVTVTLTSSDPAKVLLSTDPTLPGTSTITMSIPAQGSQTQEFYVYGLASQGASGYTASAPGFGTTTAFVTLAPSGFILDAGSGPGFDFFTVSGNNPTTINVESGILDTSGNFLQTQNLAGGLSVNVAVTNQSSAVGTVVSPVTVTGGNYVNSTTFTPVGSGTSLLTAVTPAGFSASLQASLTGHVTSPNLVVDDFGAIPVGENLEVQHTFRLSVPAPAGGVSVTFTVTGNALLSTSATGTGSTSITVAVAGGQYLGSFYVYGLNSLGSVTINGTASGYNPTSGVDNLAPSGIVVCNPGGCGFPLSVSLAAGKTSVSVSTALLDASDNFLGTESLAPTSDGNPLPISLNSSVLSVGTIASPANIAIGTDTATVLFTPLATGTTVISASRPLGYSPVVGGGTLSIKVQ